MALAEGTREALTPYPHALRPLGRGMVSSMDFHPKPGDTVLAPHRTDAVSGQIYPVEFVRFWIRGKDEMARVKDGKRTWSVVASELQAVRPGG